MPNANSLIIPFRIEVLFLATDDDTSFATRSLDYTQLPYHLKDGSVVNDSNLLIGDTVSKNAFTGTIHMPKGLHLHFILPSFLGRPIPKRCTDFIKSGNKVPTALKSGTVPAAPNRWLVKKTAGSTISYNIIVSDYIYAPDYTPDDNSPQSVIANKFTNKTDFPKPFCYIGANAPVASPDDYASAGSVDLSANDGTTTFKILQGKPLTVLGSGDPYFSAYYPNCCTVFGFLDNSFTSIDANNPVTYDIFGWHDDNTDDSIFQFVKTLSSAGEDNFIEHLKTNFAINIKNESFKAGDIAPCIYYAKKIIDNTPKETDFSNVNVTVGRSVNEAVSAYLAAGLGNKNRLEEQLESISLIRNIEHLTTDVLFKLKEARHAQGFKKIDGGTTWIIAAVENHTTLNSPNNKPVIALSDKYSVLLDTLNKAHLAYDLTVNEIVAMKEQLFVDYVNCQLAYSHVNEHADNLIPIKDLYKNLTESQLSAEIIKKYNTLGRKLSITEGIIETANDLSDTQTAKVLYNAWNAINLALKSDNLQTKWVLKPIPNHAYWKPKAPAVLIAGLEEDDTLESLFSENKKGYLEAFIASDFDSSNPKTFMAQLCPFNNDPTNPITAQSDITAYFNANANKTIQYSNQVNTAFVLKWEVALRMDYPDTTQSNWIFDSNFLSSYTDPVSNSKYFGLAISGSDFDFSRTNSPIKLTPQNINIASTSILSHSGRKGMLIQMFHYLKSYVKKNDLGKLVTDSAKLQSILSNPKTFTENNIIASLVYALANQRLSDFKKTVSIIQTNLDSIAFSLPINKAVINCMSSLLNNNFIAQTLSGFNHACLQRNITAQLPLPGNADPFNNEYDLTNINTALNIGEIDYEKSSPDDDINVFLPIQVGVPNFTDLTLIDNFGKNHTIHGNNADGGIAVNYAESMKINTSDTDGFLFPRLSQAARLDFNWLSAEQNPHIDPDSDNNYDAGLFDTACTFTNSVETSSPICGWLIPDYFNKELMVYDANGFPLGYLDENALWRVPPFLKVKEDINLNIKNEHLKRVVKWMRADPKTKKPDKLTKILDCLELAAQFSIPGQKHHYNSKALLMGNPIAVVRGAVRFRVKGLPALNQTRVGNYNKVQEAFNLRTNKNQNFAQFLGGQKINYNDRLKNEWDKVSVYLRIGEIMQYGDGLYGYWDESQAAFFNSFQENNGNDTDYYLPLTNPNNANSLGLDKMQFFTFLMDPRSGIHLTSGILPALYKTVEVHHYEQALKNMAMWFKVSALLQPTASLSGNAMLNLPKVPGYAWHLYDQFNGLRPIVADEVDTLTATTNTITESYLILKS